MQQEIAKGDVLQRIAGVALIVGAIVTAVFDILYPRASDPGDVQAVLSKLGDNETLTYIVQLGILLGVWTTLGGIVGIYRSLATGAAATWVRLGFYASVLATAMWIVTLATGMAEAGAGANWLGAPDVGKATAYSVAAAVHAVNMSLFSIAIVVQFAALILLGIAVSLGTLYPRQMGWAAIVLGVVTIPAVGIPQAVTGPSELGVNILFPIFSLLLLLWLLVMGILITRKAW